MKVKWFQVLLCMTNYSIKHQSFISTQLNVKTVLFQTNHFSICTRFKCQNSSILNNQFSISTQFRFICAIDRTLSGATTPGMSGPESNDNEGVLNIPQSSIITGASPSDCFMPYPGHSLGESYPLAEMQSVYSAAPADWAKCYLFASSTESEYWPCCTTWNRIRLWL